MKAIPKRMPPIGLLKVKSIVKTILVTTGLVWIIDENKVNRGVENWKTKYSSGMMSSDQYFIFPSL
jgi:hypothetical protein